MRTLLHVLPNEEIYGKPISHAIPSLEFANQTSCLCSTVGLHSISEEVVVWGGGGGVFSSLQKTKKKSAGAMKWGGNLTGWKSKEREVCVILGRDEKRMAFSRWRPRSSLRIGCLSIYTFWSLGREESFVTRKGGFDDIPLLLPVCFYRCGQRLLEDVGLYTASCLDVSRWCMSSTIYVSSGVPFCSRKNKTSSRSLIF